MGCVRKPLWFMAHLFAGWVLHTHWNGVPGKDVGHCLCVSPVWLPAGAGAEPTGNLHLCCPDSNWPGSCQPRGGSHGSTWTLRGCSTSGFQTFPAIHLTLQSWTTPAEGVPLLEFGGLASCNLQILESVNVGTAWCVHCIEMVEQLPFRVEAESGADHRISSNSQAAWELLQGHGLLADWRPSDGRC